MCVLGAAFIPQPFGGGMPFIWRWPFTSLVFLWTNKVHLLPYSVQPAAAVCAPGAEEDTVIAEDMYAIIPVLFLLYLVFIEVR
jgi:hypothetical protein